MVVLVDNNTVSVKKTAAIVNQRLGASYCYMVVYRWLRLSFVDGRFSGDRQ